MAMEVLVKVLITLGVVIFAVVFVTSAVVLLIGVWNSQVDPWQTLKNLFTGAFPQTEAIVQRESDTIYQNGIKVGRVVGNVAEDNDSIVFACLADTESLDKNQPFQYRRQTLSVRSIGTITGLHSVLDAGTGKTEALQNVLQGVICEREP